jgi:RecB family exonuclease
VALQLSLFDPSPEGSGAAPPAGRVVVARGARAAEALLLSRLEELAAEARRDPFLLARPVRVVVPSRSLRSHLGAAVVRSGRSGRSMAGLVIQTLHGLAFEILERAGEPAPRGMALADLLAQRHAAAEPTLRNGLGHLVDGYAPVAGTVRDLLDAGLEPVHADAVLEALAADGVFVASRAEIARALALVRVAARTEDELRERGLGRVSTLLRRASERIEIDPEGALPARAVLIHGFADATGVATDLLESLLRRRQALLVLDRPPSWRGIEAGVESAFTERFAGRLTLSARLEEAPPPPLAAVAPPRIERFQATGGEAEAREIARRVRARLDGGARPEAVAVVARDLEPYRLLLARHLRRLGVPFSALGTRGALGPAGRRARALLDLLTRGEDVPAGRWLDALPSVPGGRPADLRLAFAALGAGRLRDVAALRPESFLQKNKDGEGESYPLPIRQGVRARTGNGEENDDEEDAGQVHAVRRRVPGDRLRAAIRAAVRARDRLAAWPGEARAAAHLDALRALLRSDLGWREDDPASRPLLDALEGLEREVPPRFKLTRDELRRLLARELDGAGAAELGGAGGGVQILTVMEARGRTFDHLFLAGMNRDLFPRGVREDPLLPDPLRQVLQRVLPDVPIKRSGFDEERYLFAQLLSASPEVTLSWRVADDDGRPLSPSPLLGGVEAETAPSLTGRAAAASREPRPADERALLAALHGPRSALAVPLAAAIAEGRRDLAGTGLDPRPADLAAARLAILDEIDPDLRTPEGRAVRSRLGPWFGFVGPVAVEADLRRRGLSITYLEALAACPWQLFLHRLLKIEPTPDPLEMLPGADPLLLGNLVHGVLERIVEEAGADGQGDAAVPVGWPADADLDRLLRETSERLLAEEGIALPGLARALADQARERLREARDADWADGPVPVLRAEDEGELTVRDAAGRPRQVRFRADRVDLLESGAVRRTDYKTGAPISKAKKEETRRRDFLRKVRAGTHLQAVSYALAEGGRADLGRYLFLRPGLEQREFVADRDDRELVDAFSGAVAAVLQAWDAGSFFPRLVEPAGRNEPGRCKRCDVAEACLRHDSGSRLRLLGWADDLRAGGDERLAKALAAEAALLGVWRLADRTVQTDESEARGHSAESSEAAESSESGERGEGLPE